MLNRCEFIGNVGKDPDIRSFSSGDRVASFSLACTERWTDKSSGEKKEATTWVPVAVFGRAVDVVDKYVRKGSRLYVAGQFSVRKWQDKEGNDRYTTEVVLRPYKSSMTLLDSRGGGQSEAAPAQGDALQTLREGSEFDDEIPF